MLATAAVQHVPYAWVEQTVPGGRFDGHDTRSAAYTVYLMDPYQGPWASWRVEPWGSNHRVRQHGQRHLFDEVEAAYRWCLGSGKPPHTRFGLDVDRAGQRVQLEEADGSRRRVEAVDPDRL
ncbi:hypothetical protein [Nocardiopsis sp. CNT312]|uniref:hypothetical protein n=1 Tax=Nocardiopsis sp. CNT312 TaxID=1137268 RepID=UPI0004918EF7|nr:hypothetical protein [Nocardiopsis sp. CNT312]